MCFLLVTLTYLEIRSICRFIKAQGSIFFPFIPLHVLQLSSTSKTSVISSQGWIIIWGVRECIKHWTICGASIQFHEPKFLPGVSTKFGNFVYVNDTIIANMTIRATWTAVFPLELLFSVFLQSPLKSMSNHSAFPIFVTKASEVLNGT